MLLTAASSPRRLPRKSWEHDILIYIEWTGLQGYSSNRLKNKIKQVPLVWVSKMMQNESKTAGLEKQSPLEIHRLSPKNLSEKSASSIQRKLGSVKFAILKQSTLAYRGVNPPDSPAETRTRIYFSYFETLDSVKDKTRTHTQTILFVEPEIFKILLQQPLPFYIHLHLNTS